AIVPLAPLTVSTAIGWPSRSLLAIATVLLNVAALACTYRWLCSRPLPWARAMPGAVAGGVAFSVLQYIGTTVVARAIAHASPIYGTFASVIGLITWLSLHASIALLGAEVNSVLPATTFRS
ncbi:MAG: YhjD/YihY/BrkB family envelope integrity protein, partial [Actinomycetota bacterium]